VEATIGRAFISYFAGEYQKEIELSAETILYVPIRIGSLVARE
jgi:preprotein translocase subunit Sec61beta